ncbi:MAG TPA: CFI-box-CTERM domain-containing protein, partial [Polyangiales bacterium]|nr:CFI-box-CTERM domain-containing protein [Polyangiales bacterium]
DYVAFIEVNLEGDYNDRWNATDFPTPTTPMDDWDQYAELYGYPYRGQPSLVWKLPFSLGAGAASSVSTTDPVGRSSWNFWAASYGQLETLSTDASDPQFISSNTNDSGVDRLRKDSNGKRFSIEARNVVVPPPTAADAGTSATLDAGTRALDGGVAADEDAGATDAAISDAAAPPAVSSSVGPIENLTLSVDPDRLRSHTWVVMRFDAVQSTLPLHAYEARVATTPITDETSFINDGRQARSATNSAEGATLLTLPTDETAGQPIEATIGDLTALTHYYVGVRATDELNQHGPISVAEITTTARRFATVSPCFIATAAYGSPLAEQVSVLRRLRDRYLMPQSIGRAWVAGYYAWGARLARWIAPHDRLRGAVRVALSPLVALARRLD